MAAAVVRAAADADFPFVVVSCVSFKSKRRMQYTTRSIGMCPFQGLPPLGLLIGQTAARFIGLVPANCIFKTGTSVASATTS